MIADAAAIVEINLKGAAQIRPVDGGSDHPAEKYCSANQPAGDELAAESFVDSDFFLVWGEHVLSGEYAVKRNPQFTIPPSNLAPLSP